MTSNMTFNAPATVDLQRVQSIADMALREGFDASLDYTVTFAQTLCRGVPLDVMRERFIALTSAAGHLGSDPDKAAALEIGQHLLILDALFRKLVIQSVSATDSGGRGSSEAAERLLNGALKAQRAAMACLSSLKVLRETVPAKPPTATRPPGGTVLEAVSTPLSGSNEVLPARALD